MLKRFLLFAILGPSSALILPLRKVIHRGLEAVESLVLPNSNSLPNTNLKGIFEPVPPTTDPVACQVEGSVPPSCFGIFCRNGPNANKPILHDYFIFDGDGMIHSVQLEDAQKCTYSSAYVNTHRFQDEEALGGAAHAKVGDLKYGPASLLHLTATAVRQSLGVLGDCPSLANTSLLWHKESGSIIAMHEMGAPYVVDIRHGNIKTLGRTKFGGQFSGGSNEPFTAHPKIDPNDDVLYAFGYSFFEPTLKFYRFRQSSHETLKVLKIPLPRSVMMHDFCITETHAIFLDNPLIFDLQKTTVVGELPFQFEPQHGSRLGVIPLTAQSADEIQWFELPQSTFVFHTMNAWNAEVDASGDEEDIENTKSGPFLRIVKYFSKSQRLARNETNAVDAANNNAGDDGSTNRSKNPDPTKIELVVAQYDDMPPFGDLGAKQNPYRVRLWKYGVDLTSGELYCNEECADTTDRFNVEFPVVPPKLLGRKSRYGYFPVNDRENNDLLTGFFKVDLEKDPQDAVVGRTFYGSNTNGGEGQFVPSLDPNAAEDDGHYMVFTNTEQSTSSDRPISELRIYETKTMSPDPVAVIKIPSLVPFGFHGTFVPKKSLEEQDMNTNLKVKRYSSASLVKEEGYEWED